MAEVQFAYRFFVGHNDAVDMMELEKEAALYNDVEILNFVDNYQTLPEKACPWMAKMFPNMSLLPNKSGLRLSVMHYMLSAHDSTVAHRRACIAARSASGPSSGRWTRAICGLSTCAGWTTICT
jgi:hypothetical protein